MNIRELKTILKENNIDFYTYLFIDLQSGKIYRSGSPDGYLLGK